MVAKPRANVYLWTGDGWGKTTSALGVALRAVGHDKKVTIIQFMKGRGDAIGEFKVRHLLEPWYEIHQFGARRFVDLKAPSINDKHLAAEALSFALVAAKKKPFLLILDEVNIALAFGLIKIDDLFDLLDRVPRSTTIYLTGRYAPPELIKRADYVTEVMAIKRPKGKMKAKKGIDY